MSSIKFIGVPLKEVPKVNQLPIPIFDILDILSSQWKYILQEGIFRVPGDQVRVNQIRDEYMKGNAVDLRKEHPNTLCSLLKLYIRLIPGMLLTSSIKDMFLLTLSCKELPEEVKLKNSIEILKGLNKTNYYTLKHIIYHLHLINQYSKYNLMDSDNLSMVFAPAFFSLPLNELMDPHNYGAQGIKYLIDNYSAIFTDKSIKHANPEDYQRPKSKPPVVAEKKEEIVEEIKESEMRENEIAGENKHAEAEINEKDSEKNNEKDESAEIHNENA